MASRSREDAHSSVVDSNVDRLQQGGGDSDSLCRGDEKQRSMPSVGQVQSTRQDRRSRYERGEEQISSNISHCSHPQHPQHPKRDHKFKYHHHSLWYRLRRGRNHTGVVELDPRHPLHPRLAAMSVGLQTVLLDKDNPGPKDHLLTTDYSSIITQELYLESHKSNFTFESFATAVFATIRRAVDVNENMYLSALASPSRPFMEFMSNSRSGQDFILSSDMRYLIKTNRERDIRFLLSVLGEYLQHFLSYPHSLLVKYLGCYSIKLPGRKKKYFLVMQNIFYPASRIEDRFDVKGCTAGRYQEPSQPDSHAITVLKDQNFFQEELELGSQKEWFLDQVKADSTFLRNLNVMDYSLLVGRQRLHADEQLSSQSFPEIVTCVQKSVKHATPTRDGSWSLLSLPEHQMCHNGPVNGRGDTHEKVWTDDDPMGSLPGLIEPRSSSMLVPHVRSTGLHFPQSLSDSTVNFPHRLRLLPGCPNALHIIDGPNYRYFFGIVDFLTRWTYLQKMARLWKMVKYGCGEHSTVPPDYYSRRFVNFLANRVT